MSKYIDNLVSLSAGLRTPSEKTENMMSPRLSTHKAIAQVSKQVREISAFIETHKRKLKSVIPRIRNCL